MLNSGNLHPSFFAQVLPLGRCWVAFRSVCKFATGTMDYVCKLPVAEKPDRGHQVSSTAASTSENSSCIPLNDAHRELTCSTPDVTTLLTPNHGGGFFPTDGFRKCSDQSA